MSFANKQGCISSFINLYKLFYCIFSQTILKVCAKVTIVPFLGEKQYFNINNGKSSSTSNLLRGFFPRIHVEFCQMTTAFSFHLYRWCIFSFSFLILMIYIDWFSNVKSTFIPEFNPCSDVVVIFKKCITWFNLLIFLENFRI